MFDTVIKEDIIPLIDCAKLLSQKYDVVITNPPYTPISSCSVKLQDYVKKNYPDSKTDFCSVFIERCKELTAKNGYQTMITMHSWMFLSSYEKLRSILIANNTIINMAHLGARAFDEIGGEVVQTTTFVFQNNSIKDYLTKFKRLVDYNTQDLKEEEYLKDNNLYITSSNNFNKIPGKPLAYWVSKNIIECFKNEYIYQYAKPCKGIDTGNNDLFLRMWYEISNQDRFIPNIVASHNLDFSNYKWLPYNKGGTFRKWYGNNDYVINWENNGLELRSYKKSNLRNKDKYFKKGITWSTVASGSSSFRFFSEGFLFDNGGSCLFSEKLNLMYIQGFLNSKVATLFLNVQPTLNTQPGTIGNLPLYVKLNYIDDVAFIVEKCISLSKSDWDSFETSWDFEIHPLIKNHTNAIKDAFDLWNKECNDRFNTLKSNEEELNKIFIDIYGLQDELDPYVEDKDVTVRKADELRDIKSFISYAVGCMFGRYSLDEEGLIYAGGVFNMGDYHVFKPDMDNIIPISEVGYFEDDITFRFIKFISKVFGEDSLQDNLAYIAKVLGGKGTPEEVIRNYFINEFYKDHVKMCQKRPIYWLFDSGKNNGFKALIYMHRYNADTVSNVRTEYLHKFQNTYEVLIKDDEYIMDHSDNKAEATKARKHKENLEKKLAETRIYDQALAHIANKRIDIDLDDGVKVNYEKFQDVEVINEGSKAIKVNLLGKI